MVKKVLVETEHSFRVLNLCIGNNEIHMLNEREIFAILKKPGKIKMFELSKDEKQRVLITKDNYNIVTTFVNDNPVEHATIIEKKEETPISNPTEKVITPVIHEPKKNKKKAYKEEKQETVTKATVEEPVKAEESAVEEVVAEPVVEETVVEEPTAETTEDLTKMEESEAEMTDEDKELAELEEEIKKMEAEEKKEIAE